MAPRLLARIFFLSRTAFPRHVSVPVTRFLTDDLRIAGLNPLVSPAVLAYYLPVSEEAAKLVATSRATAEGILKGADDRLLVVMGPCSIHNPDAAREYAGRLKELSDRLSDDLFVIMRVYFEKPRTTVGWKGLINDPHMDGSFDINHGLHVARKLLLDCAHMGVPAGTEFLDTISPQFIADLIAWGAIGARTAESWRPGFPCRWASKTAPEGRCRSLWTPFVRRPTRTISFP